uniref:Protein transport protein SEC24-like At3g07100 n=1 Tax=Tanacetum cinerariifolium TaxID=118510 RepID=A0A6L2JHW2_TANCI|nr:protein transport protein SEC24-like At3g07100 [Tanacetum cinerariifolium]
MVSGLGGKTGHTVFYTVVLKGKRRQGSINFHFTLLAPGYQKTTRETPATITTTTTETTISTNSRTGDKKLLRLMLQNLHAYFAAEEIHHQTSVARTPEQNGIVKRRNRTLVEAARTMLNATKVPLFFWAKEIATACFTQNRSLVIPRHEKTPCHIINNRKPSVKFFHIFGSLCYIVRDGENLDKMKEKGDECVFVGYSTQSRAYRVFNKRTRVIMESIHVNFDELPQMASDHISSDPAPECQRMALEHDSLSPAIQRQANVPQADRTVSTSNELDLLFSTMFDELLNGSSKVVSTTSAVCSTDAPNQRQQHTTPLNIHTTLAPTVSSSENINQGENDQVADDEFINIFCTPVQDQGETSSRHVDSSNMHTFYQRYPSEHRWIKDHPLEQVIGNPSQSVRTRRQLESDAEMCTLAKYTGGQVYYYPSFHSAIHNDKLRHELARDLTRETAWEAVMRIRCGKGVRFTSYHGNFMLRSTDLLALPAVDCDKAYAMQFALEETLLTTQIVYFQVALLHTSSSGERRIRVHTAAASVVADLGEMYRQADTGAIVSLLGRLAIEKSLSYKLEEARNAIQLRIVKAFKEYRNLYAVQHRVGTRMIYPESLKYLPLYGLALCKSTALRGGYGDSQLDERCAAGFTMMALPVKKMLKLLYPSLLRVDEYLLKSPMQADDFETVCKRLPLAAGSLDSRGIYIYDDGFRLVVWFGNMLSPDVSRNLVGEDFAADFSRASLGERDNEMSRKLMKIIKKLRAADASYYLLCHLVRQGEQPREGFFLLSNLVEDQTGVPINSGGGGKFTLSIASISFVVLVRGANFSLLEYGAHVPMFNLNSLWTLRPWDLS